MATSSKVPLPSPFTSPTTDAGRVSAIANVMMRPPSVMSQGYVDGAVWSANFLHVSVTQAQALATAFKQNVNEYAKAQASNSKIVVSSNDEKQRNSALTAQANVFALIKRVNDFAVQARNAGFEPPDNPFTRIAQINSSRGDVISTLVTPEPFASDLIFNVKAYVNLLEAFNQGGIDFQKGVFNTAQLSHIKLSFSGLGGTGNTAADIKSLLPSLDAFKKETSRRALEVLDFRNRIPSLLFTLDYVPQKGGTSQGTIVAFRKIADASGYVIKRRAVFSAQDRQFQVGNASVTDTAAKLLSYARTYALGFFDKIDEKSVLMFLDTNSVVPDEYYVYRVTAYQAKVTKNAQLFVNSTPVSLTPVAKSSIGRIIRQMSNWPDYTVIGYDSSGAPIKDYNNFQETISPWPAFSQHLYGDSSYDWLLAAVNIRSSINRRDDRSVTRQYSYLSAHSAFLEAQADAGKLVKPASLNSIISDVDSLIQTYGVSQAVQLLLDETGITYYIEGRDPSDDSMFDRGGLVDVASTKLFSVVAAAIDPATATLNLKQLASNMTTLLGQQSLDIKGTVLNPSVSSNSSPSEVAVPDPDESTSTAAEGPLQFINQLGDLKDPVIDLTSFDGLSKLLRAIRIISDFGPNRLPPASPPKNVPPPPPPPPPKPEPPPKPVSPSKPSSPPKPVSPSSQPSNPSSSPIVIKGFGNA